MIEENKEQPPLQDSGKKKGGKLIPALCNILGTLILLLVIGLCLPMAVPRLAGCEVYNITTGSMEPEIPVGSIAIVKPADASGIQVRDVIAFMSGDSVITHRVMENHTVEGEFITKGDANAKEDMGAVPYDALVGKVVLHIPALGGWLALLNGVVGKVYLFVFALCGVMFHMLAGRLRNRE